MLRLTFSSNWIGALTLSLLLKLPPRKLKPWFILWSFFLLRLYSISVNLPCSLAWNTVVTLSLGIYHAVLHGILLSLYLCESTMQSCMEYCCHIWACVPSCYLELLELMDRLQRHICRAWIYGYIFSNYLAIQEGFSQNYSRN